MNATSPPANLDQSSRKQLGRKLRPHIVYSVSTLQEILEIPMMELIAAASAAEFRFLGEGKQMHIIGQDCIDWLEGKPVWNCSESTREQADTVRHQCHRAMSQLSVDHDPDRT